MQKLYFQKISFLIPLLLFCLLSGQFLDKKIYGSESAQCEEANVALSELDEYNCQFKEWSEKEKWHRKHFFSSAPYLISPSAFISKILQLKASAFVVPLNGQIRKYKESFILCKEHPYLFLIQSKDPIRDLLLRVYDENKLIHEEKISLPDPLSNRWQNYLIDNGKILTLKGALKNDFGLEVRIRLIPHPDHASILISQKGSNSNYIFSVVSEEEDTIFYTYMLTEPPPYQLNHLLKPAPFEAPMIAPQCGYGTVTLKKSDVKSIHEERAALPEQRELKELNQFVEELKKDPLALAQYVQNEIELEIDTLLDRENGVFFAPSIRRNCLTTFLNRKGSPWEQCMLLVYLLRQAGYEAVYTYGAPLAISTRLFEQFNFVNLANEEEEILIKYPWVQYFDGEKWISLFPWIKEVCVEEGHDLYGLLPEQYASAERWVKSYLTNDENLLKYASSSEDDTAGFLFLSFVREELAKQGLAIEDIGISRSHIKKQFHSWQEFPRLPARGKADTFVSLKSIEDEIFSILTIDLISLSAPHQSIYSFGSHFSPEYNTYYNFAADLDCQSHFLKIDGCSKSIIYKANKTYLSFPLESTENLAIKVTLYTPKLYSTGIDFSEESNSFPIFTNSLSTLCFSFGHMTPKIVNFFYKKFENWDEPFAISEGLLIKHKSNELHALLGFLGAAYFEKCCMKGKQLAQINKTEFIPHFSVGMTTISADNAPYIDMYIAFHPPGHYQDREKNLAHEQFLPLFAVDQSASEHQILHEIFDDPNAVSTVKLLQLAHKHKGLGVRFLTKTIFNQTDDPKLKEHAKGQWNKLEEFFNKEAVESDYTYAFMTSEPICSENSSYRGMGTLVVSPFMYWTLISDNLKGGYGSKLSSNFLFDFQQKLWTPSFNKSNYSESSYRFAPLESMPPYKSSLLTNSLPIPEKIPTQTFNLQENIVISPATMLGAKSHGSLETTSIFQKVGDPVDVVTGAFYVDELDLVFPGPFPLEIRRNYNSKNLFHGSLGCGWKLSLNPNLIEEDDKLYAAEKSGATVAYRLNPTTNRWEVFPEDNPELFNFNQQGTEATASLFHSYIENDILYSPDGSKRIFKDNLLRSWIDPSGNTLTFSYDQDRLSRIESSFGAFCGFKYDAAGRIFEVYTRNKRIYYKYNFRGDLTLVTLPNGAKICYEYDQHRLTLEQKPGGGLLKNEYDDQGRVIVQYSPIGKQETLSISAQFDYEEGRTTVTDPAEHQTNYFISEGSIYKIVDPEGHQIIQSWFIDNDHWLNGETGEILSWNQEGGFSKSLKSITDKRGLTTDYLYDKKGNITQITTHGKDLTGKFDSTLIETFAYNERNLCTEKKTLNKKTTFDYDERFPYLIGKIENYIDDHSLSTLNFTYNTQGQLTKEEHSGFVTTWHYDERGFPCQKIEKTGTEDPDRITTWTYGVQGQCILKETNNRIEEYKYDISGNVLAHHIYTPDEKHLQTILYHYDLNQRLIWQKTDNKPAVHFRYNASGLPKVTYQKQLSGDTAYAIYAYNRLGSLIEEVSPLEHCTYRRYDSIQQLTAVWVEDKPPTTFTYEPGGEVATMTSPLGHTTRHIYTTNGLLKETHYPDGTFIKITYDLFGRPTQETTPTETWDITYNDIERTVTRTHKATQVSEVHIYDARNNLILYETPSGARWEKSYDHLSRIKTETNPDKEITTWNYEGNQVICHRFNGEKQVDLIENGQVTETEIFDPEGKLVYHSRYSYDPKTNTATETIGDILTITTLDHQDNPIKVQTGDLTTTYNYDLSGQCIEITDGEGHTTTQGFDAQNRFIKKTLSDGTELSYTYDDDSNLISYELPTGATWEASYDSMGRMLSKSLIFQNQTTNQVTYTYQNGLLAKIEDSLGRTYLYSYDKKNQLIEETVDLYSHQYDYDDDGFLIQAIEKTPTYTTITERKCDFNGRIITESIFIDDILIQETEQDHLPDRRILTTNGHTCTYHYQNGQVTHLLAPTTTLNYTYNLAGQLTAKITPVHKTTLTYNDSGLPQTLTTQAAEETLSWSSSGRITTRTVNQTPTRYDYNQRGQLVTSGQDQYTFDFNEPKNGIRTTAPHHQIKPSGIDVFGRVTKETIDNLPQVTTYDTLGQTLTENDTIYDWDPWGRLIKVTTETSTWEAIYDPLGRRIQTAFSPQDTSPTITTAFYDPEEEFREIGLFHSGHTFWKLGRDNTCDAIIDDQGQTAYLIHNSLDHLNAVIYPDGTIITTPSVDIYGSKQPSLPAHEITSYAQTLAWHSKETDPTGLVWLGKRYYNPQTGRFLSPDPVGGFACIDMYGYVMGDPINFYDLNGRWKSSLYSGVRGAADSVVHTVIDVATFSLDTMTKLAFAEEFVEAAVEHREINPQCAAFMEMGGNSGAIKEIYNFTIGKIISPPSDSNVYEKAYDVTDWAALGSQLMRGNFKKLAQLKSIKKCNLNRINHIFGPKSIEKHNLGGFLNKFSGDQIQAFESIEKAVQNLAKQGKISGIFETTVKIKGSKLVVRGKVINGTTKIGTVFIP